MALERGKLSDVVNVAAGTTVGIITVVFFSRQAQCVHPGSQLANNQAETFMK